MKQVMKEVMKQGVFLFLLCVTVATSAQQSTSPLVEHVCDDYITRPVFKEIDGVLCVFATANCYFESISIDAEQKKGQGTFSGLACSKNSISSATLCSNDNSEQANFCLINGQEILQKIMQQ